MMDYNRKLLNSFVKTITFMNEQTINTSIYYTYRIQSGN